VAEDVDTGDDIDRRSRGLPLVEIDSLDPGEAPLPAVPKSFLGRVDARDFAERGE
jgi:hypothetical protein